jgi:hypothetical protein
MNKIEDRRAALNDAPRLDAVRITGVCAEKSTDRPARQGADSDKRGK